MKCSHYSHLPLLPGDVNDLGRAQEGEVSEPCVSCVVREPTTRRRKSSQMNFVHAQTRARHARGPRAEASEDLTGIRSRSEVQMRHMSPPRENHPHAQGVFEGCSPSERVESANFFFTIDDNSLRDSSSLSQSTTHTAACPDQHQHTPALKPGGIAISSLYYVLMDTGIHAYNMDV